MPRNSKLNSQLQLRICDLEEPRSHSFQFRALIGIVASQQASKPASRQAGKPASRQASKPANQQASKPASQQASKPASKPANQQASKPASQQASKPASSKQHSQHQLSVNRRLALFLLASCKE
jgi:uncharacterized membrane protein